MPPKGWKKNPVEIEDEEESKPEKKSVDHPGFNITCGQCGSAAVIVQTSTLADFTMTCTVCGQAVSR